MTVTKYGVDADGDTWWKIDGDINRLICAKTKNEAMLFVREGVCVYSATFVAETCGPIKEAKQ